MTTDDKQDIVGVAVVYVTFPNLASAQAAAAKVVDGRLAACVNIIPGMRAIYIWQGVRQDDEEVVFIAKTRTELVAALTAAIRDGHPYSNPAIVAWPAGGGSAEYLGWVLEQTAAGGTGGG